MKTEKKILITFLLNLFFSIFEFVGGIFAGSIAIISDAVHDLSDATSVGISYFLERKSNKQPDEKYTYGYARFSVLGSVITTVVLLVGSIIVACNAIGRIISPTTINYDAMIIFAVAGVAINLFATLLTRDGHSLNQKAVNLHMLEDVLGWIVVLIGAIVMKFTNFAIIDPIMSIGIAVFIFVMAFKNLIEALEIFLEKTPIEVDKVKSEVLKVEGVEEVHHVHVWSMDGNNTYATMHVVTDADAHEVKHEIREALEDLGIYHVTLEIERKGERCHEKDCLIKQSHAHSHHHHHHH